MTCYEDLLTTLALRKTPGMPHAFMRRAGGGRGRVRTHRPSGRHTHTLLSFWCLPGTPIHTRREDMDDRARIAQIYAQTKAGVQGEIAYLLQQRERDPYRKCAPAFDFAALFVCSVSSLAPLHRSAGLLGHSVTPSFLTGPVSCLQLFLSSCSSLAQLRVCLRRSAAQASCCFGICFLVSSWPLCGVGSRKQDVLAAIAHVSVHMCRLPQRLLYETINRRQAPTFTVPAAPAYTGAPKAAASA